MLTANKVKDILSKIARAGRAEGEIKVDEVTFRLRVISKGEADLIDARRAEMIQALEQDQGDLEAHLSEVVTSLKRDTLAYAIISVDGETLDEAFFELEDGGKVEKYVFMTEHFLPALTISVFDSLYSYYMDLFQEADQRAGRKVEVVNTDTETEISILKARLDALEATRVVSSPAEKGDAEAPTLSREEARELVFKPLSKDEAPPVKAEEPPPADPAKTVIASKPHEQYHQQELDESERLFMEREQRRRAFASTEPTAKHVPPQEDDTYLLEPMPRPRLTPQNLNQPPRGAVNPNFKGPKP